MLYIRICVLLYVCSAVYETRTYGAMRGARGVIPYIYSIAFVLLWLDYRHYIEKYGKREFRFIEFVKNEGLYLFLLLMFVFLIGGEILLYHIF